MGYHFSCSVFNGNFRPVEFLWDIIFLTVSLMVTLGRLSSRRMSFFLQCLNGNFGPFEFL